MKYLRLIIKNSLRRFLGIDTTNTYLNRLISRGLVVGENLNIQKDVILDDTHCWLITIGDNVTLAPRVHVLCHDTSTKNHLGYTKVGLVNIADNVFIGANSTIMPGVSIGANSIIAANSFVNSDVEEDSVYGGVPAKKIARLDSFVSKNKSEMTNSPIFSEEYTMRHNLSDDKKEEMIDLLKSNINRKGFIK